MRTSRTAQQTTQEALAFLNGRMDKQDSEIRSLHSVRLEEIGRRFDDVALQQRSIVDRVGRLGEYGETHERGLLELNDKVKRTMGELSNCTAIATKSLETSAQSFAATRELQTENMKASKTVQQTMQEALVSLKERIDKQDSEIRSLHSARRPVDEGFLDRQRVDGDRTNDKISELSTQLYAAQFELSNTKAEVNRKLQEISDSHGANRHSIERVMADLSDGLQTCQSDLHKFREETDSKLK